jgi:hypothetical protein
MNNFAGSLGMGRPERTRSSARCRNSGGYGLGIRLLLLSEAATYSQQTVPENRGMIKVSGKEGQAQPPQVLAKPHSHPPLLVGDGTDLLVQATGTTSVTGSFPYVSPAGTRQSCSCGLKQL